MTKTFHSGSTLCGLTLSAFALGGFAVATQAAAATFVPDFGTATFAPGAAIDNPYFPLKDGQPVTYRAEGIDEDGEPFAEETRLSFGGPGRVILGVQTSIQRDFAFEDGLLVEDTFDYYAQDAAGNVWYMGEDVVNFVYDDDGNLVETNTSSSWIAGENGATPGYIMPNNPIPGFAYFQEVAPNDNAIDEAEIWATGLSVESGGTLYEDVIAIFETNSLEPDAREFKYYAPDFGLIRIEEGLDMNFANPELTFEIVSVPAVPVPASLPLFLTGLAGMFAWRRGNRPRVTRGTRRGVM